MNNIFTDLIQTWLLFHEKMFCWREIQTGRVTDDNNADIVEIENST